MIFTDRFKVVPLLLCFTFVFIILSCLFIAALRAPAGKLLSSWFPCVLCFLVTFPYGISLDVSIPDLYYLLNFSNLKLKLTT